MLTARLVAGTLSVVAVVLGGSVASGQDYPNKIIRVFTSPAGGGTDLTVRMITQAMSPGNLGQPLVVENRQATIAIETVAKAPPDGYSLLVVSDFLYLEPLLKTNLTFGYDAIRDFSPITMIGSEPQVLIVNPSLPAKSVQELLALAKAKPGELNYASNGPGSITHLAGELLRAMTGINIVHVPYKSTGQALNEVLAGIVQMRFNGGSGVTEHVKSGKLRALAVASLQPSALFPGVPTLSTTVPGYSMVSMLGVLAPAKTPAPIVNRLNQEFVRTINQADVKEKLLIAGTDVVGGPPEQLSTYLKTETAKWSKVIKDAGIKLE